MAKQLNRTTPIFNQLRRISLYNNNRTKSGFLSLLDESQSTNSNVPYNEKLEKESNWSDWSELTKQFKKTSEFPFPGRVGLAYKQQTEQERAETRRVADSLKLFTSKPDSVSKFTMAMLDSLISTANMAVNPSELELKAYNCPESLLKDFEAYFRDLSLRDQPLTVITLSFKTENDMSTWNNAVDSEREVLVKKFVDTAKTLCNDFELRGFWADYIDPSSGRPSKSKYTYATFFETDERYRQLGFEISDQGCCKVISHHKWGSKAYVGCLLTTAFINSASVTKLLEKFNGV